MSYIRQLSFCTVRKRFLAGSLCLLMAVATLFTVPAQASYLLTLDFAQNPTLPSAQGMSFATDSTASESTLASIVGGSRLKIDTFQLPNDRGAFYFNNNFFSHTTDLEMEIRLKIFNSSNFGFSVAAYNSDVAAIFVISRTNWRIDKGPSGNGQFDFSQDFNTFKFKGYAATNTYDFFVNGNKVSSGTRPVGYSGNQFYFGDGTSTGGNVSAEVQYVRYSNQNFTSGGEVPEPISVATWSLLAGGLLKFRRRRS